MLGGSDGFNIGRPTLLGQSLPDAQVGYVLYLVTIGVAAVMALLARVYFDSTRGLVTLAVRENELRVEYLGGSVRQAMAINFVLAAFCGGVGGALVVHVARPHRAATSATGRPRASSSSSPSSPAGRAWLAVFVASTVLEVVRSFSSSYFPNTWQLALGLFLLFVIRFLPRGIGSLWISARSGSGARERAAVSAPVLRAPSGVGKRFGAVVAAAEINVAVAAGERVSLIGSNGAGKTTFVNMITGYLKPDAGHIRFDGRDITALAPRAITRLGVARSFQIPQLCGELTVLDNMLVANACHDQRLSFWQPARRAEAVDARRCAAASAFASSEHRDAPRRRAARRRAQAARHRDGADRRSRKLLLLDEPTSGVSAEEKFPMMDTIMAALRRARR